MAETQLIIKIDAKGNLAVLSQATDELKGVKKGGEGARDALGGLKRAATLAGGALAAIKASQVIVNFAELGGTVQATRQRFVAFAGGQKQATEYMDTFRVATDGAIDRMGAMAAGSKLLQMGLVDTADEMGEVAAIAVKLGDQTIGAQQRMQDLALTLANRSNPRLDNFGISSGVARRRVEALTQAGMDLDQAFKLAVLEEGRKALERLGDTSELVSTKIARSEAAWEDVKNGAAEAFATFVDGTGTLDWLAERMGGLSTTLEQVGMLTQAWGSAVGTYLGGEGGIIARSKAALGDFNGQLRAMALNQYGAVESTEALRYAHTMALPELVNLSDVAGTASTYWDHYDDALTIAAEQSDTAAAAAARWREELEQQQIVIEEATTKYAGMAETLFGATEAQIASVAIGELGQLLSDDKITVEDYRVAVTDTQLAFGLADQASIDLTDRLLSLVDRFGEGKVKAGEFDDGLAHLITITEMEKKQVEMFGARLRDLPTSLTTTHTTVYKTVGSPPSWTPTPAPASGLPSNVPHKAGGGAASGWTVVGENGPEIVQFPVGSHVFDARESAAMAGRGEIPAGVGRGGGEIHLQLNVATGAVRSDEDIERIMEGTERILALRGARMFEV